MAETYRFDPVLALTEMDAILAWCHTNGITPEDTPVSATVVIDGPWITIDQFVRNERGHIRIDEERDDIQCTQLVVPLIARPELASLKRVEDAETGDGGR